MIQQLDGGFGKMWEYVDRIEPGLAGSLVIELGGGQSGWGRSDWMVDLRSYDKIESVKGSQKFTQDTFISADLNDPAWANRFSDRCFDLVFCNHTLEDIRDPIGVLRVIKRIGKRALIGVPHWSYEFGIRAERPDWERVSGFPHHRWFVGTNRRTGVLEFMAKLNWFIAEEYPVRQPNLNIEWDGGDFEFAEITNTYPGVSKRSDLVAWLEDRWV